METVTPIQLKDFATALVDTLPAAVKRSMTGQYEQLMAAHRAATGYTCFLVGRQVYFSSQNAQPLALVTGTPPGLHPSLVPAFQAWEQPFKRLNQDLARIKQTIGSIVMRAKTCQDIRNMFPDHFLRPLLNSWLPGMELQRTSLDLYAGPSKPFTSPTQERLNREALWDPHLLDMYERVGGTIDLYLGYKLL